MAFVHPRASVGAKALLIGGALYGITPFDLVPDMLPLLGVVDDAAIIALVVFFFLRMTKGIRSEIRHREGW